MKIVASYESKETSVDHLSVTAVIETGAWKEAIDKVLEEKAKTLNIKGFRKGKVPMEMVRQHVDMAAVFDSAIRSIVNPALSEIIADMKIKPLVIPSFNPTAMSDTDLRLEYNIVLLPKIKLGKYKGHEIGYKVEAVTSDQVKHEIEHLRQTKAVLNVVERPAQLGDTVIIDFEGYVDGKAFEGGKADNHELKLGSGSFIPGFEEQLVGKTAGDKLDVKVKFPKEYHAEALKDKDATFKVKMHEVKEETVPALDDAFAASLEINDVKTVAELERHEMKELSKKNESEAKKGYLGKLIKAIVADSETPVYEEYIERVVNDDYAHYVQEIEKQSGGKFEDYLKMTNTSEEGFIKNLHDNAVEQYKVALIVNKIVETEEIVITDAEVDFELAKMADTYKMELAQLKQILAPQLNQFRNELLNRRFEEFLLEHNK